jgi:hypothetical protein
MKTGGWILLITSWGIILSIVTFCFSTMLRIRKK